MNIVAIDVIIEAFWIPHLVIHIQAQRPADWDSVVQMAQHMKAVMKFLTSESSKPVLAVMQGTGDPGIEAERFDLKAACFRCGHDGLFTWNCDPLGLSVDPIGKRTLEFPADTKATPVHKK